MSLHNHLQLYLNPDLTPVSLRFCSKQPLIRYGNGYSPACEELMQWFLTTNRNGCDSDVAFPNFTTTRYVRPRYPVVKTGRGYHIWMRTKKPIKSQRINGVEIRCFGSYAVAPPSIHRSGIPYIFEIAPNSAVLEVDLETLLGLPTDSAKCQVQRMYATTRLGSQSVSWCVKVQLVRDGKDD